MITRKVEKGTLIISENDHEVLQISEEKTEQDLLIKIKGNLKFSVLHDFEDELTTVMTLGIPLIIDMEKLEMIAGTAIGVFVRMQKHIDDCGKGSLKIRNLNPQVSKVFEDNGFYDLLEIEEKKDII